MSKSPASIFIQNGSSKVRKSQRIQQSSLLSCLSETTNANDSNLNGVIDLTSDEITSGESSGLKHQPVRLGLTSDREVISKRPASSLVQNGSFEMKKLQKRQPSSLTSFLSGRSYEEDSNLNEVIDLTSEKITSGVSSGSKAYKIYCDLDGVLVDFDAGVRKIFNGLGPDQLAPRDLWPGISRVNGFFEHLPWTKDGNELWNEILLHYNGKNGMLLPDILTGVPRNKEAREQKFLWCRRELVEVNKDDNIKPISINHLDMAGPKYTHDIVKGNRKRGVINVITCWSKNKHFESYDKAVLIDDNVNFAEDWENKGGIFIHHTKTKSTLEKLRHHGVLPTR